MLTFIPSGGFATDVVPFPGAAAGGDVVLAQLDILAAASGGTMHAMSGAAVDPFVFQFSIFVLAVFVGYFVVWSVTPALHTPLMSVTNAISSVIVVGALLAVGVALLASDSGSIWARALGFVALVFASVNIFGGFLVTQRMLGMYHQKKGNRGARDER
jgi:NAD(P) transhydrogenase subunit alpha